mmetsp:Transcript_38049/g.87725  ORF Transcript_38049/g.87725 Transcript_38049/m.87725 type:complete len:81 (+) Transcript_38049:602-844(+)
MTNCGWQKEEGCCEVPDDGDENATKMATKDGCLRGDHAQGERFPTKATEKAMRQREVRLRGFAWGGSRAGRFCCMCASLK